MEDTEKIVKELPEIPKPDLDDLDVWLKKVVDRPSVSFKTGINDNTGQPLTRDEQVAATRKFLAEFKKAAPRVPKEQIQKQLVHLVRATGLSSKFK